MVNRVILIGNLGQDPEIKTLENGTKVAKLSVATNENYKDRTGAWQSKTEWHTVICWRSIAEKAENSIRKGVTLSLEGKLTTRTWQDQNGNNRRATEVVANYFRTINKGSEGNQNQQNNNPSVPYLDSNGAMDDDLPF